MKRIITLSSILVSLFLIIISGKSLIFYYENIKRNDWNAQDRELYPVRPSFCNEDCTAFEDGPLKLDARQQYYVDFGMVRNLRVKGGHWYFPGSTAQAAIAHYAIFRKTGDVGHKRLALSNADWLVANIGADGCWPNPMDLSITPGRLVKAPWCSGLAQGTGISALVRAWRLTGDAKYKRAADLALHPYRLDAANTVTSRLDDGGICYEEVYDRGHPTCILNGFIFALYGLADHARAFGDPQAKALLAEGMTSLSRHIAAYDTGYWSRYSLDPVRTWKNHWAIASPNYQRLHSEMLESLATTGGAQIQQAARVQRHHLNSSWANIIIIPAYVLYQDTTAVIKGVQGSLE